MSDVFFNLKHTFKCHLLKKKIIKLVFKRGKHITKVYLFLFLGGGGDSMHKCFYIHSEFFKNMKFRHANMKIDRSILIVFWKRCFFMKYQLSLFKPSIKILLKLPENMQGYAENGREKFKAKHVISWTKVLERNEKSWINLKTIFVKNECI